VIDTTGSVIYTGEAMMQRLRRQTVVIYLSLPLAHRKALRRAYQAAPRPVVWQQHFRKRSGENDLDALKRCYDDLLESRELLYRQYAHLEIEWDPTADPSAEMDTLLAPVNAFLAQQRLSNEF
jgi:shikimate kinase